MERVPRIKHMGVSARQLNIRKDRILQHLSMMTSHRSSDSSSSHDLSLTSSLDSDMGKENEAWERTCDSDEDDRLSQRQAFNKTNRKRQSWTTQKQHGAAFQRKRAYDGSHPNNGGGHDTTGGDKHRYKKDDGGERRPPNRNWDRNGHHNNHRGNDRTDRRREDEDRNPWEP